MGGKPRSQSSRQASGSARGETVDWDNLAAGSVARLLEVLQRQWPDATIELDHDDPYQLLVATMLSAQSTDKRVNLTTPALFARFPAAAALAEADLEELEELVHSTGFFRMKARNLLAMARQVVADHEGEIPATMSELVALPGVARKTANIVLGVGFAIASGIAVDTHVQRLAHRLGLSTAKQADKIEADLTRLIPPEHWINFTHQLILHGRRICTARKPACDKCPLASLCPQADSC